MADPRDPLGLRAHAPLLDAYWRFREANPRPFTIPGHKQRTDLVGEVVLGDVPLFGGLDTMRLEAGALAEAEAHAARLWGADLARFSVGGSTHGNQALALAIGQPGDEVIMSRTLHRSLLLGLVLADLRPVWVHPPIDDRLGIPLGVAPAAVAAALAEHPKARAVFIGDPSYAGTTSDTPAVVAIAHAHGIPLIVDAAWGAHLGFHPSLPPHAMATGADAVVTSAHKMLPAYSAAAIVLARTERIDPARLDAGFEATHTTSPPGAPLASIDAARALLEHHGERLLATLVDEVAQVRTRLAEIDGVVIGEGDRLDPTRLLIGLAGTGANGIAIASALGARGMPLEYADRDLLIPAVTMADTGGPLRALTDQLLALIESHRGEPRRPVVSPAWQVRPEQAMSPREAFFAPARTVPAAQAIGQVSAELIAPYPPGVPALAPGERITADLLDALQEAQRAGIRIAYAADPSLTTLRVIAD